MMEKTIDVVKDVELRDNPPTPLLKVGVVRSKEGKGVVCYVVFTVGAVWGVGAIL